MHRLLILACSQRKDGAAGVMPAIDRYDGPAFRVLRKFLLESPEHAPRVLILSARYGLIDSDHRIPEYDCRMSPTIAERLRPYVIERLRRVVRVRHWQTIGLCVGRDYSKALADFVQLPLGDVQIDLIGGGLGHRLANLHAWLRFQAPFQKRTGSSSPSHDHAQTSKDDSPLETSNVKR
jgi:hypothetical protein